MAWISLHAFEQCMCDDNEDATIVVVVVTHCFLFHLPGSLMP